MGGCRVGGGKDVGRGWKESGNNRQNEEGGGEKKRETVNPKHAHTEGGSLLQSQKMCPLAKSTRVITVIFC